jgi:hypothetical protein
MQSALEPVALALRFTLLSMLLRPIGPGLVRPCILGLAAAGLLLSGLLRHPGLWIALTFLTGLRVFLDWSLADNHAYLLCYWCLAVSIALCSRDPSGCLSLNGRLLIGLAFVFATLWKVGLSPEYLDGRFFRVTLLTDPRFSGFAQLAGGLLPEQFEELRAFVKQHVDGQLIEPSFLPAEPPRFILLAACMTWWTVAIEGAVALAFLWPVGRGLSKMRDAILLTFCVTTYAVATVAGFGWLLLALGVAQCEPGRRKTQISYLIVFALILFYRDVPWVTQLLELSPAGEVRQ